MYAWTIIFLVALFAFDRVWVKDSLNFIDVSSCRSI